MSEYLSDDWFAAVVAAGQSLPEVPGLTASLAYTIAVAPKKKVQFVLELVDGRIVAMGSGKGEGASCAIQLGYEQARGLLEASLDRDVLFMRGDLKLDGDYASYVLRLVPWFGQPSTEALRRTIAASTTY